MGHLEEVKAYWNQRAKGFSMAVEEELASECGKEWESFFQGHLPDGSLDILDDGTGAGFFAVILSRLGASGNGNRLFRSDDTARQRAVQCIKCTSCRNADGRAKSAV